MNVRKSIEQQRRELLLLAVIGSPFVMWLGFVLGPLLRKGIGYFFYHTSELRWFPINISPWNWKYALGCLAIYAIGVLIYVSQIKDIDVLTPDGSMKFGDPSAMYKKYANKKRYPVINENVLLLPAESSAEHMREEEKKKKMFSVIASTFITKDKVNNNSKQQLYNNMNKVLTQNVVMGLNGFKTKRNLNTVVIGGSGSGKTRFVVKPNLLQGNTSFIILDPKGELLRDCGYALAQMGYKIKVLNLVNMQESDCYNPFRYLDNDNDIQHLVDNLFKATGSTESNNSSQDPFWDNAAKALLTALVSYCHYFLPEEEQNYAAYLWRSRISGYSRAGVAGIMQNAVHIL